MVDVESSTDQVQMQIVTSKMSITYHMDIWTCVQIRLRNSPAAACANQLIVIIECLCEWGSGGLPKVHIGNYKLCLKTFISSL